MRLTYTRIITADVPARNQSTLLRDPDGNIINLFAPIAARVR